MYSIRIHDDDDGEPGTLLGTFLEVKGLEYAQPFKCKDCKEVLCDDCEKEDTYEYSHVQLINGSLNDNLITLTSGIEKHLVSNIFICLLHDNNTILGEYYMADLTVTSSIINDSGTYDLTLNGILHGAHKGTLKAWNIVLNRYPLPLNEWTTLEEDELFGWLEVALKRNKNRQDISDKQVELNGADIHSVGSFYCVLGEAINGPGGYFGWNLGALSDCFCGGFGVKQPLTIIWKNFSTTETQFPKFNEFFYHVQKIFKDSYVELIIER